MSNTIYANKSIGCLTVLHRVDNGHRGQTQFLCRCSCGTEMVLAAGTRVSQTCHCDFKVSNH